ncbi:CRISPR system precrRNA processing endoribonuclease RAMP protein Cas6 [Pseudoalteromonas rubra]|uniref:CRISPR-associated protein Cas6 C-terminal domain-containing protein n=1 Tax=Pseudoalteromonas rubra TaxID=43658 RepID=A0A0F4QYL1_9GAMM|nr:CRISPR system precrRNA processing endoribonuclease RAMP protein Cas6 [Pseudoalteromonas rubra]KJZ12781.1 hypothetical protein TW77_02200 [Pseudoalteromonas rubra]
MALQAWNEVTKEHPLHNALEQLCGQIPFTHLSVTLTLHDTLTSYPFSGSLLHGALTNALNCTDPSLCQQLLSEQNQSHPRAYFFVAPFIAGGMAHKDQQLRFELKLFGDACAHLNTILQSVFVMQKLGLGKNSTTFSIGEVLLHSQGRTLTLFKRGEQDELLFAQQTTLADHLYRPYPVTASRWRAFIQLTTPVSLVRNQRPIHAAPPLSTWLFFIANRLNWLCDHCLPENAFPATINTLLADSTAQDVPPDNDQTKPFTQRRQSATNDRNHALKGLLGTFSYPVDEQQLSWLQLGSALQIGKKTNYGQGAYQLDYGLLRV